MNLLQYVDQRLDEWAKWYLKGNWYGVGYPTCSQEYKLMTFDLIRSTAPASIACNPEAEEIEALVVEMEDYGDYLASALRQHYFGKGGFSDRAKLLGISYPKFRVSVCFARHWLAGRLSALQKNLKFSKKFEGVKDKNCSIDSLYSDLV